MTSFGSPQHKLIFLEFAQQHFDPIIWWGGLDKINVHKVYNL
jgi:hypothetical protein